MLSYDRLQAETWYITVFTILYGKTSSQPRQSFRPLRVGSPGRTKRASAASLLPKDAAGRSVRLQVQPATGHKRGSLHHLTGRQPYPESAEYRQGIHY